MDRDAIREFVARDWAAIAASKDRSWQELKVRRSAAEVLRAADQLRAHARRVRPDWPAQQDRLDDLLVHTRVGEALRAVARGAR
jgi:hypothetical protein